MTATIRIRKAHGGPWARVPLLAVRLGWVQVRDSDGPLWVQWEACYWPDVWAALLAGEQRNWRTVRTRNATKKPG